MPAVTRDGTKFNHVVTALPSDALNACKNIIRLPVTNANRYELLRNTLITTYGKTAAQKHAELIEFAANKEPILDQKPSSILLYIQELSGDSKEAFERQVLLNRLPESVQTTLATSSARTNAEFALEANKVMESYLLAQSASAAPGVSSVSNVQEVVHSPEVAAVARPQQMTQPLCYVHARYGRKAYSCRSASCPMRNQVQPPRRSTSGNGGAGRLGGGRQ